MKTKLISILILVACFLQACSVPLVVSPTPTSQPTSTPTPTPIPKPTSTLRPTSTPDVIATQQYEAFYSSIQRFYEEGYIPTKDGIYTPLADQSEASIISAGYYQWKLFEAQPGNFIIQASVHVNTESADGGCGFIFHVLSTGLGSHKVIYFGKDGFVRYFSYLSNHTTSKLVDPALASDPSGVKLTLIVYEDKVIFLVNDQEVLTALVTPRDEAGLGLVMVSGSNKDARTNCDFDNIVLWTFKQ